MIGATSRLLVVHSPRPVAEARAILARLLGGDDARPVPGPPAGIALVDGAVDATRVTFTAVPREGASLEFDGTIDDTPDGSVLVGSISAPMALGVARRHHHGARRPVPRVERHPAPARGPRGRRLDLPLGRRREQPRGAATRQGRRDRAVARGRARRCRADGRCLTPAPPVSVASRGPRPSPSSIRRPRSRRAPRRRSRPASRVPRSHDGSYRCSTCRSSVRSYRPSSSRRNVAISRVTVASSSVSRTPTDQPGRSWNWTRTRFGPDRPWTDTSNSRTPPAGRRGDPRRERAERRLTGPGSTA